MENEWGWVEEIAATYVVIRLWDWRRLVLPISYFIEKPFQNWTRETAGIIGTVIWQVDYAMSFARMREKLDEFLKQSKLWDGKVGVLQVIDTTDAICLAMVRTTDVGFNEHAALLQPTAPNRACIRGLP